MNIAIGSDHAGFDYKERLKLALMEWGHDVTDFGTEAQQPPVDYPQIVFPLAEAVRVRRLRTRHHSRWLGKW